MIEVANNQSWSLPEAIDNKLLPSIKFHPAISRLLLRRGYTNEAQLREYLNPLDLPDSRIHFKDLTKAIFKILSVCNAKDKIAICGDYDADGITSTALLINTLKPLGANPIPFIPSRKHEGYGLNKNIIRSINEQNITTAITVDNGISSIEAISLANDLGIDIIITDHHKIPSLKQNIYALIHPDLTPNDSPFRGLAGVGIAYMLAKEIYKEKELEIRNTCSLELFCIGTIADMAPIIGANKKWLKEGLSNLSSTQNEGLKQILKNSLTNHQKINELDIGFKIAPVINAVGRLDDPMIMVELLTTSDKSKASLLSKKCIKLNNLRKEITSKIEHEAETQLSKSRLENKYFILLENHKWHNGIIGIVASRILDKFHIPTALLGGSGNGTFRGSVRSNTKLNVYDALNESSQILEAYGGHSAAGGFTVKAENISNLRSFLNQYAKRCLELISPPQNLAPEAHLSLNDITEELWNELNELGPFGIENKRPMFWARNCKIIERKFLKGGHLKMIITNGDKSISAIQWKSRFKKLNTSNIDIVYYIDINNWGSRSTLQIEILDIKESMEIVPITFGNRKYYCELSINNNIKIKNSQGKNIDKLTYKINNTDINTIKYMDKLFSVAEIALGLES